MENTLDTGLYWHPLKRIVFRFVFIFFLLFIFLLNNGAFPFWDIVMIYPEKLMHTIIPWVGKRILHLSYDITVFTNGSGDTTYDYVQLLCIFLISIFAAGIWSLLDTKRTNYIILYYWLSTIVRFYIGLMLINYGFYKVMKLQFPSPGIFRLTETYGESSPMGLAWTFLGFSESYNLFMGIAEMTSFLLLFRRTMTIGAIITLMTTSNVMAMNYFYDIPVKIHSTALVLMTLFLLLNDAKRLWIFFFTGEAINLPVIQSQEIKNKFLRIAKPTLKYLIIGYALIYGAFETWNYKKQYEKKISNQQICGLYEVNTFIFGNDTLSTLTSKYLRWNQLVIEKEGYAKARLVNDSVAFFYTTLDTTNKTIQFDLKNGSRLEFKYNFTSTDSLHLLGPKEDYPASIFLTRKPIKDRLTTRGFHWISEYPYNK